MHRSGIPALAAVSLALATLPALADSTSALTFTGNNATYSDTFLTTPGPVDMPTTGTWAGYSYNFYDDYTFTITSAQANLVSITSTISFAQLSGITNLQARLFSGTGGPFRSTVAQPAIIEAWGPTFSAGVATGSNAILATTTTPIAAGTYTLEIRGLASVAAPSTATYSGQLSVQAVPEPQTWAMFAAGLALLGFGIKRRVG